MNTAEQFAHHERAVRDAAAAVDAARAAHDPIAEAAAVANLEAAARARAAFVRTFNKSNLADYRQGFWRQS